MRYLKVTNKGTFHRKFLEIVGLSNKRDKVGGPPKIGYRGSGLKFIPPACLRLGLNLMVCSSDEDGRYTASYLTRDVSIGKGETVKQVFIAYDNGTEVPLFSLEALIDWDKPIGKDSVAEFKTIREVLANAKDEDSDFRVEIVEEGGAGYVLPLEGETSVFLTLTSGVEEAVFNNPARYFKFIGKSEKPLLIPDVGEIYKRSSDEVRVFLQGILVECAGGETASLFDYSLFDSTGLLSEDRVIKDNALFRRRLVKLLLSIDSVKLVSHLLASMEKGTARFESRILLHMTSNDVTDGAKAVYLEAWRALKGKDTQGRDAVIASGDNLIDGDARFQGYKIETLSSSFLRSTLIMLGIPQTTDFVSRSAPEYKLIELGSAERAIFDKAYAVFLYFCPQAKEYPVRFFETNDPKIHWNGVAGLGEARFKEIWLSGQRFGDGLEGVLCTLIHEYRHCVSKAQDYTAEFQKQADKDEAEFMLRFVPPELLAR